MDTALEATPRDMISKCIQHKLYEYVKQNLKEKLQHPLPRS